MAVWPSLIQDKTKEICPWFIWLFLNFCQPGGHLDVSSLRKSYQGNFLRWVGVHLLLSSPISLLHCFLKNSLKICGIGSKCSHAVDGGRNGIALKRKKLRYYNAHMKMNFKFSMSKEKKIADWLALFGKFQPFFYVDSSPLYRSLCPSCIIYKSLNAFIFLHFSIVFIIYNVQYIYI